jgi:hypothetical protein
MKDVMNRKLYGRDGRVIVFEEHGSVSYGHIVGQWKRIENDIVAEMGTQKSYCCYKVRRIGCRVYCIQVRKASLEGSSQQMDSSCFDDAFFWSSPSYHQLYVGYSGDSGLENSNCSILKFV